VSTQERIFERDGVMRWKGNQILGHAKLGVTLSSVLSSLSNNRKVVGGWTGPSNVLSIVDILNCYEDEKYVLWISSGMSKYPTFLIVLKEGADVDTQLKAWLHALICAENLWVEKNMVPEEPRQVLQLLILAKEEVHQRWDEVRALLLDSGWDLQTSAMETRSGTRISVGREKSV